MSVRVFQRFLEGSFFWSFPVGGFDKKTFDTYVDKS